MITRVNPFDEIYRKCNSNKAADINFPQYIDIELTNNCNYRCLMCPTGIGSTKREKGFMSKKVYLKVIEEIEKYKLPIRFIRWGEPTLHKEFYEFVKIAKKNGLICHFNTNGFLLNKECMQYLIDLHMDSVKFSFQGVDRISYKEMRNKDAFDELVEKIKIFSLLRGDKDYPYLHVSTTTTYESDEQIEIFKNRLNEYVDCISVGKTNLAYINAEYSSLNNEERELLRRLKNSETLTHKHKAVCPEVFDKLSINWDGTVSACCSDYDNYMLCGDVKMQSLYEIWHSKKMETYRKMILNEQYDRLFLCKTCFDYIELKN